jgi:hypothetical protein
MIELLTKLGAVAVIAASCMQIACAVAPPPPVARPGLSPEEEAQAIEAARRHPIAQPRRRTLYPEQSPPPLATPLEPTQPPPLLSAPYDGDEPYGQAPGAQLDEGVVTNSPPPAAYADSPDYAAPSPDYVWAPGYWGWSGTDYLWVRGEWLAPRPGYSYIGPRWTRQGNGWQFGAGGWARAGAGYVEFPVYRHPRADAGYQPYRWPGDRDVPRAGYDYRTGRGVDYPSRDRFGGARYGESRYPREEVHVTPRYRGRESYAPPSAGYSTSTGHSGRSAPPNRDQVEPSRPRSSPTEAPNRSAAPVTRAIPSHDGGRENSRRVTIHTR